MPAALVRANFNTALIPNLVQRQFGSVWNSVFSRNTKKRQPVSRLPFRIFKFSNESCLSNRYFAAAKASLFRSSTISIWTFDGTFAYFASSIVDEP